MSSDKNVLFYPAGSLIFAEDTPGDLLYSVIEGEVEISKHGKVLEIVTAEGIFGEMALVDNQPRNATARAKTDCKLRSMDEMGFLVTVQHQPFYALTVMRTMAERIRVMARELTDRP